MRILFVALVLAAGGCGQESATATDALRPEVIRSFVRAAGLSMAADRIRAEADSLAERAKLIREQGKVEDSRSYALTMTTVEGLLMMEEQIRLEAASEEKKWMALVKDADGVFFVLTGSRDGRRKR